MMHLFGPRRFRPLVAFLLLLSTSPVCGEEARRSSSALESIRVDDLRRHVATLASDALEGREAGARGGKAAGAYLIGELHKLGIQPAGDDGAYYQHFDPEYRNVLAVLPGSDERLRDEFIVVGAHYDHVGYGNRRNSRGPTGQIHNGADDNASGTAALLELIDAFQQVGHGPRRSILFAFWDAEEKGLLGSKYWVAHPTVPLAQVRLMINADMIGRLRDRQLEVFGTRTAAGLRRFVSEQNRERSFRIGFNWDVLSDSDHHPFYRSGVPVLMLHTMKHDDYHRPSDDADRLEWDGLEQISRFLFRLASSAADADVLPAFRREADSENEELRERIETALPPDPPRLGLAWDGELARQGRIVVTNVAPESPAERAGLQKGDTIWELGGVQVLEADEFRRRVLAAAPRTEIVVRRPGEAELLTLALELRGNPIRVGIAWRTDAAEPGCVILSRIVSGSAAEQAGLRAADRIYQVGEATFETHGEFRDLLNRGTGELEFLVERAGQIRPVTVVLP